MWEIILASLLSLSAGVRAPQIDNVPADYEFSYQVENDLFMFKHDFERENGLYFNDIRGKINYDNNHLLIKEDFKQITSKNLYQFNSDIRYLFTKGISIGGAFIWDLDEYTKFTPSLGYTQKFKNKKLETNIDSDIYITQPLTYQLDFKTTYNITEKFGVGVLSNYIQTKDNNDYSAKIILTIKFK